MTRQDHLLVLVAEEATEIALQACKALRFGLEDTKPGDDTATNAVRIVHEFTDLLTVLEMLSKESKFFDETASNLLPSQNERMQVKREKVERLLPYSYTRDRLDKLQA